ncbi:MAG: hypothetical protein KAI72_07710, partial [Candidatus Pacebacteria bacterium]|nr:hypothetical protein [Candidatus Paceibacterota bacterium]
NTGYVVDSPRLDYTVNFTQTGIHYVWVRGIGLSGNDDSCHVGLNGQAISTSDSISSFNTSWEWSRSTMDGVQATLSIGSVGQHTFNVWMREDGFVVDKIVLTTNSGYVPTGLGPDETLFTGNTLLQIPELNAPVSGDGQVDLSWNMVSGAEGYNVYYGTASGNYDAQVDVGDVASYTVGSLTNGTAYFFVVTAYDATEESGSSNEQSAAPVAPPPGPLTEPVLNPANTGDTEVHLTWSAVADATGYKIKYGTTSGGGAGSTDFTRDSDCVAAWKFDETSGAVIDSCGVNSGTISGTVVRGSPGQYDNAIEFLGYYGGNNAIVRLGSDASVDNLRARTFTAWIHPHSMGSYDSGTIINKDYQDG